MDKKGQSALEYLMTYGWALVVIVIVVAALFALGILDPSTYQGRTCQGFSQFAYVDHTVDNSADNFQIILKNGTGAAAKNLDMNLNANGTNDDLTNGSAAIGCTGNTTVSATGQVTLTCDLNGVSQVSTGSFSQEVEVQYQTRGLTHIEKAVCTGTR